MNKKKQKVTCECGARVYDLKKHRQSSLKHQEGEADQKQKRDWRKPVLVSDLATRSGQLAQMVRRKVEIRPEYARLKEELDELNREIRELCQDLMKKCIHRKENTKVERPYGGGEYSITLCKAREDLMNRSWNGPSDEQCMYCILYKEHFRKR